MILQAKGLNKSLIYEALKTVWTFSKQFLKNKRVFDDNDIQIFKYYKHFSNREEELQETIKQKEAIIKIKDDQTQKYALLKQEEKKEKEEWIKKYDIVQNEKSEWVQKYYAIKMYMVVFLVLLMLASILIVYVFSKNIT